MKNKYLYFAFFLIFIGLLITIIYLTFFSNNEYFADTDEEKDATPDEGGQDESPQDDSAQADNSQADNSQADSASKDDIPKIDVQQSDTQQTTNEKDKNESKSQKKAPLKVLDDTERKLYEKELATDPNYKDLNLNYDKIYEGGREYKPEDIDKSKQKITSLPLEKDLENRQLYKDPNENLDDKSTQNTDNLIDIDEDLTIKDKGNIEFPRKDNVVKYDFFKCNLDVDSESEAKPVDKKKYPCNASIHERYMFGCKPGLAFPTELQQSVGSDYDKTLEDPSNFYKKINRPIMGAVDNFDWNPHNMVDYSNVANYFDIGKIPLDKNKVIPVQYNYVFKNSPSFSFI